MSIKLKSKGNEATAVYWMHMFMYYYKMSYNDFLALPLSVFYSLREELVKQIEAENKTKG